MPVSNPSTVSSDHSKTTQGLAEMAFSAQVLSSGVCFRLWAPDAALVELVLNNDSPQAMAAQSDGWLELTVANAKPGDLYWFRIDEELMVPDPASRYQPQTVHGQSEVVDPNAFDWQDTDWKGLPWEETVIYELHVGTFTPAGTFKALTDRLDYLKDLGITAIELMPLAQCPGERNWGYDGVLPYAPANQYGTPDDLKTFIQTAHKKGFMVFLDVVYNHFGPEGNYLHTYAKRFFTDQHKTPWGAAINFEHKPVRGFFIHNALYWLNEYHFDGLRFDAVHAIKDESTAHFLHELADQIRAGVDPARHIHLMLENDDNQASFLTGREKLFNAQWNDDFHHAAHVALTNEAIGYYEDYSGEFSAKSSLEHLAQCLTSGYAYQAEMSSYRNSIRGEKSNHLPTSAFVNFLQNHDQIGNRAMGNRLSTLAAPQANKALLTTLLLSPTIPLLFMGEEWQSQTPFQFFCDFGPELAASVTEGRRREFSHFTEFSDPEKLAGIPDPCDRTTFETSKLTWEDLQDASFNDALNFTKTLLKVRHNVIVPMMKACNSNNTSIKKPYVVSAKKEGFIVAWPLPGEETLVLVLNLSEKPLLFEAFSLADMLQSAYHRNLNPLIFESEPDAHKSLETNDLPACSAIYLKVPSWKQ